MKITFAVSYFPPEIGSAADLFYHLSKELKNRGYTVQVLTTKPRCHNLSAESLTNKSVSNNIAEKSRIWSIEYTREALEVLRLRHLPVVCSKSARNLTFRSIEHVLEPFLFLTIINRIASSNFLLVYSPPLMLGYLFAIFGKFFKIPTIINVQDIHPQALIDSDLIKNKFLISTLKYIERQMYAYTNAVVVHSDGNKKIVVQNGSKAKKTFVISNSCSIPSETLIQEGKVFKKKLFLGKKFVITYAGTMSVSQDLVTIIKTAKLLNSNQKKIFFVLAGDGPEKGRLISLTKELKINNVLFLPFQLGNDYWRLLSASDVCLVSLRGSKVKTPVVPRKLQDIMAAGRPLIAHVPPGDIQAIVEQAQCGITIDSESPINLSIAIKKMYNLPREELLRLGSNGRFFALQKFSAQVAANEYEYLFNRIIK